MQKNAAYFVCNDYKLTTSTTGLVKSLGWDILQHRRLFNQPVLFINSVMVLLIASFLSQLLFPAKSGLLHATRILISNLKQNDVSAFPFFFLEAQGWELAPKQCGILGHMKLL